MKVAIIGLGFLGRSIVDGLNTSSSPDLRIEVSASKRNPGKGTDGLPPSLLRPASQNRRLAHDSHLVWVCVRNEDWVTVAEDLRGLGEQGETVLISTAPGMKFDDVRKIWGSDNVIKSYPSIPVAVRAGFLPYLAGSRHAAKRFCEVSTLIGRALACRDEQQLMAAGLFSSSGPALVLRFLTSLHRAFADSDLPAPVGELGRAVFAGTARWVIEKDINIEEGIDMIATPGGRTREGLRVLEEEDLDQIIAAAYRSMLPS
ncbi:MAG: NAD(P)-binding domain-containing protein [Deltaproteobacteria bacterium]|nr:NAD(P)-binding domain-containing protein [Deltaproteobacteria bacterium]